MVGIDGRLRFAGLLGKRGEEGVDPWKTGCPIFACVGRAERSTRSGNGCNGVLGVVEIEDVGEALSTDPEQESGPGGGGTRHGNRPAHVRNQRWHLLVCGIDQKGNGCVGPVPVEVGDGGSEQDDVTEIAASNDEDA